MRLQQTLEKYLPLIGNMLIPAAIFAVGLLGYLFYGGFSFDTALFLHRCFYALNLIGLLLLLNFNCGRPLFFMASITITYIALNYIKSLFGDEFFSTVWLQNLATILPWNLLFFYIYSKHRFISRQSLIMVIVIISEYTLIEILGRYNISLDSSLVNFNIISWLGFAVLIIWSLAKAIKEGKLYDYAIMFAALSIGLGIWFVSDASGITLFFCLAQVILLIYFIYTMIYNRYYDETTSFYNRNSYLTHSSKFPLKYSLGIVSIDSYDKLVNTFGYARLNIIIGLIADILQELTPNDIIYRYAPDEFIILYKSFDKKEAFEQLENIRRIIASLSFAASSRQSPLKITVSCSVAEKKRSDAGAAEVLQRADKAMRKTLKFSHNVTSQG